MILAKLIAVVFWSCRVPSCIVEALSFEGWCAAKADKEWSG